MGNIGTQDAVISQLSGLYGTGGTPSIVLGSAAGTGATSSIVGTNLAGKITLNTGLSLLTSGTVMTLTFANGMTYPTGCFVTFSAANGNFAGMLNLLSCTTTATTAALSVTTALSISTTYVGYYQVIGY